MEPVDSLSENGFSRQYLGLHFQDHRIPPPPRELRDQSFVVTSASRLVQHLYRSSTFHQSFVVTRASRPVIHPFQSSIFDRDWSSPVVTRGSRPELHLRLSSTFHLSSTSVFRDYIIRCLPLFKPLPTTRKHFFLATTTGPGVVATIYSDNLDDISLTSAAMHRWTCRSKPLLGKWHDLSGHYYQLRRHQPSAPTSWDIFCRLLQPPRGYGCSISPILNAPAPQPSSTTSGLLYRLFQQSHRHPRCVKC